jgi:hypothetical protein
VSLKLEIAVTKYFLCKAREKWNKLVENCNLEAVRNKERLCQGRMRQRFEERRYEMYISKMFINEKVERRNGFCGSNWLGKIVV